MVAKSRRLHIICPSGYAEDEFKIIKMMGSMNVYYILLFYTLLKSFQVQSAPAIQVPFGVESHTSLGYDISAELFADLEELSRLVDISYCVGLTGTGIQRPFQCVCRCHEFHGFDLVTVSTQLGAPLLLVTLQIPFLKDMEHRPVFFR